MRIRSVTNALGTCFISSREMLRSAAGRYPWLFLPYARLRRRYAGCVVDKRTEVVIEGYPRSGNTFAVVAFRQAQMRPIRLAHHLHLPAQVRRAHELKIPTIVLVREPLNAVVSRCFRVPSLSVRIAVRQYIDFYAAIRHLKGWCVIAPFEVTTSDFGAVIGELNDRFHTDYRPFVHTPETEEAVFSTIDRHNDEEPARFVGEHGVARPSDQRRERKQEMAAAVASRSGDLLVRAEDLYREFMAMAKVSGGCE